ncbi:tigger transposable element-derived protein 1-like [Homarus americanus]|uniref:tigger transposable element-derived protein 1-like n=1 Tax=Homarus americanus TaxID=6706 RepID=UPI001C4862D9|nr:tigger transposable element-derived protein 1-like [Homarus americanus]
MVDEAASADTEAAKKYRAERKALLLLDNAPSHPINLNDLLNNIKVEYLPKNTTALLQLMDQGVMASFKAYFLCRTFRQLIAAIDGEEQLSLRDFWKQFNITNAKNNIADSWDEVKNTTMNDVWKNIWPECIQDFQGFPQVQTLNEAQQEIIALANGAGLEDVDQDGVVELLE